MTTVNVRAPKIDLAALPAIPAAAHSVAASAPHTASDVPRTAAVPATSAPSDAHRLQPGDRGTEVLALQASLIQLGINERIKTPVDMTGIYDQPTERGVQAFQLMHGMDEVTGIADRTTLATMQQQTSVVIAQHDRAPQQAPRGLREPPHGMMAAPAAEQGATAPERRQPDLHAQQQSHVLEQQRQWQLQQEQTLQQERGRLAEQEKAEGQRVQAPVAGAAEGALAAQRSSTLGLLNDPAHPGHALYADVKARLEVKGTPLPEDRLHQATTEMYIIGFKPDWRGRVDVVNDTFYAQYDADPTRRMHISLAVPAPSIQESMQQVQTHTLETARQQEAAAQAIQDQPTPPGPVLG